MGVRKGDHELKAKLDDIITRNKPQIQTLLESYGVPLIKEPDRKTDAAAMK